MKYIFWRIIAAALVFFLWGCSLGQEPAEADRLTIASWNIQNLFDGIDNGFEYDDFKNSEGWNDEKYRARLNTIGTLLKDHFSPDILALTEIENAAVIMDLAQSAGIYQWTFFASLPESAIGLGLLSKVPLTDTKAHAIHTADGSIPRPIAEVWVDTTAGPLVLFICHWKSKLGGARNTEALRRSAAAIITRRLGEIHAENPDIPVIITGDLNINADEFFRIEGTYPTALLPDTIEAAELSGIMQISPRPGFQDFLVLSSEKTPRSEYFPDTTMMVYSPWLNLQTEPPGSFYYQDNWETIDHFLLNAALLKLPGWHYEDFFVLAQEPFTDAEGKPRRYNPRTGNGLSDHLPIVLALKLIGP